MRYRKMMATSLVVLGVVAMTQQSLRGGLGDCSAGLTKITVSGAKCGGFSGTGMPCENTDICGSPAATWMTSQPGCATGFRHMWDTAPVMSTCVSVGFGSCKYCGGGTSPSTGMHCASGHLYSSTGFSCVKKAGPGFNQVCSVKKYCGGKCCKL